MAIVIDGKLLPEKLRDLLTIQSNDRDFQPGLVIIVPDQLKSELERLPVGKKRIQMLESNRFRQAIQTSYGLVYNKTKKVLVIDYNCSNSLLLVLKALSTTIDPNTIIWTSIPLDNVDCCREFVRHGFYHPYISRKTPQKTIQDRDCLALSRLNRNDVDSPRATLVLDKIEHLIQQHDRGHCFIRAKLSARAIEFLKTACYSILKKVDGKKVLRPGSPQLELTGQLNIAETIRQHNQIVYIIDVVDETVQSGEKEDVEVEFTRYNFHSHPHDAYIRHSVKKAWPSVTDYFGVLKLGQSTIFHCVATLEGVYVMALSPYWAERADKIEKKFISRHYLIPNKSPLTPQQYVNKVNAILYRGQPIFYLHYLPWDRADRVFAVNFSATEQSCLLTDPIVQKYKLLHK